MGSEYTPIYINRRVILAVRLEGDILGTCRCMMGSEYTPWSMARAPINVDRTIALNSSYHYWDVCMYACMYV